MGWSTCGRSSDIVTRGCPTTTVLRPIRPSRSVLLLWVQYFCCSFPWYFYITFLSKYLQEYHHLNERASARYAILPLLFFLKVDRAAESGTSKPEAHLEM